MCVRHLCLALWVLRLFETDAVNHAPSKQCNLSLHVVCVPCCTNAERDRILTTWDLVKDKLPFFLLCTECMQKYGASKSDSQERAAVFSWLRDQDTCTNEEPSVRHNMSEEDVAQIAELLQLFHTRELDKDLCSTCKQNAHKRRRLLRERAQQEVATSHFYRGEFGLDPYGCIRIALLHAV